MNVSVVILAAGFGTRMKSKIPKVLHKISGFPMLYHIVKEAKKISDDISVVLYHQASQVQKEMDGYFDGINYVIQDVENFPGTGGAMMKVEPRYEKVLVLNGDMPLVCDKDMERFFIEDFKVVMSYFVTKNPFGYGRVVLNSDKEVIKIVEEKDASDEQKRINSVNAGVYLFDRKFLKENLPKLKNDNSQGEYYLTDLIGIANEKGLKVKGIEIDEENFMGVNSKFHLSIAEEIMQNRIKKRFMENGVIMRLPSTVYIEAEVEIEGESVIENGVSLLGGSKVINSHIKSNSVIENSIVENSQIGPMARVRPDSVIKESKIGNFVEIKKSTLNGVKAGHLSYLGDSEIDEGTNIGCGSITCNYDGKGKHKTIIGKNVFVGSDTQFVAPVKIEDEVIIASGTTVTKDLPKGSLAINRHPLKIVENFFYKFFGNGDAKR